MSATKLKILEVAEKLAKQRGFNCFSYRDIAAIVGIKGAGVHHHFPAKDDLAVALIENYTANVQALLKQVDASNKSAYKRIEVVFEQIRAISGADGDFCLCGMFAVEIYTLSEAARDGLHEFFALFEQWMQSTIQAGVEDGSMAKQLDPKPEALLILSIIEGAMLLTRVRPTYLSEALAATLSKLKN